MKDRQQEILHAIVKHFTETAQPVGSQTILVSYKFDVSPATIRNDMAELEKQGLLFQPHTSAGRIPTDRGYRLYVDTMTDFNNATKIAKQRIAEVSKLIKLKKVRQRVYDAVNLLSHCTNNVSFATLGNQRTFFLGIANVLKQPEFSQNPYQASQVFEVLEDTDNFLNLLNQLDIEEDKPSIYIGEENILEKIKSCSIIIARYELEGHHGYIGILGPTRMNYPVNSIILAEVRNNI